MEHLGSTYSVLTHTLSPWGYGHKVKIFLFLKVGMLHIKLKGMKHRAHASTCSVLTHPRRPWGYGQKVKSFLFLKLVMLHIKLKEI